MKRINARLTLVHPSSSEWYKVSKLFRVVSNVYVLHILHELHLALAASSSKIHTFPFQNSEAWLFQMQKLTKGAFKVLLLIQNQQAALWNYLASCKWTSAMAILLPTWFGENHWHAVSTSKWLLRVTIVREHRVKISPVWLLRFDFLGACLAVSCRQNLMWILRRLSDLRDLRKKRRNVDSRR